MRTMLSLNSLEDFSDAIMTYDKVYFTQHSPSYIKSLSASFTIFVEGILPVPLFEDVIESIPFPLILWIEDKENEDQITIN